MNTPTEPKTDEMELRELDAWISEHVMGDMVSNGVVAYWNRLPNGEPEEVLVSHGQ